MAKKGDSRTMAQRNRAIRQEALREQLSAQGHVQHVVDICSELNDLGIPLEATDIQRKKIVLDTKLALIKKYCPDLKAIEHTGESGSELVIKVANYKPE